MVGAEVLSGLLKVGGKVQIIREEKVVKETNILTLRVKKDKVESVGRKKECGVGLEGIFEYQEGDVLEMFEMEKVERNIQCVYNFDD